MRNYFNRIGLIVIFTLFIFGMTACDNGTTDGGGGGGNGSGSGGGLGETLVLSGSVYENNVPFFNMNDVIVSGLGVIGTINSQGMLNFIIGQPSESEFIRVDAYFPNNAY